MVAVWQARVPSLSLSFPPLCFSLSACHIPKMKEMRISMPALPGKSPQAPLLHVHSILHLIYDIYVRIERGRRGGGENDIDI